MPDRPDTRALARQQIHSALDEVVAQIIFQADRLERFDVAVPFPIACELAQRVNAIVLALARYWEGAYQASASLAIIADPGQEWSMKTGLLWFDDNPNTTLEDKVLRAAAHYERKYGRRPNLCFVHPGAFDGNGQAKKADGVEVRPGHSVLRDHFWLGLADET